MLPVEAVSHNGRKPLLRAGGNGFQNLRKVLAMPVLQQKEIVATRVLRVPKSSHFRNRLHLWAYATLHNLFCSKKYGACLPVFSRKGVL